MKTKTSYITELRNMAAVQRIMLTIFLLSNSFVFSQAKVAEAILNEGKLLYRLELGSWYGTDNLMSKLTTKKDSIGGYLSYVNLENRINTIFFSSTNPNYILVRYEFDSLPQPEPLKIDISNHGATDLEKDLISLRLDAVARATANKDKFFSFYENTSLNFIPIINENERAVFVLTGPQNTDAILLGNDYKLFYNKKNKFVKNENIHNTLIVLPTDNEENTVVTSMHSHVLSDYISSTDVCTLLLYKNYASWTQHIVVSANNVSIFDMEKETLFIMTADAWEKIYNSSKEK